MPESITEQQRRITLIMVLINAFTTPLMLSAVNVALPHIAKSLTLDAVVLSWVPMAYLMASAMFLFLFGRLADVYGCKRIFLIGTFCVLISSLLAAFSTNAVEMISARFFQGVSAAMLYATQIAIVTSIYPPKKRGRVVGLTVSMIYLGLSFGPLLGGILIDQFGWRSSFVLHIPLAILVLLIGVLKVPGEWLAEGETKIDLFGALIYAAAIALFCVGVTRLPDSEAYLLIGLSVLTLLLFIKLQYSLETPLLNVKLFFSNKAFSFSCAASLIMYTSTFANVVLISLYLQYLKGYSATATGTIMMIQPLTMALFSPLAGKLSDRIEPRIISSIGMCITLCGLLILSILNSDSSLLQIIFALLLTGLGFSFFSSPNVNAIMSSVEKRFYGSATAVMASMRIVGQLSSMVLVAMIFSIVIGNVEITPDYYPELQQSIRLTFLIACGLCVPGIVFSLARGPIRN